MWLSQKFHQVYLTNHKASDPPRDTVMEKKGKREKREPQTETNYSVKTTSEVYKKLTEGHKLLSLVLRIRSFICGTQD